MVFHLYRRPKNLGMGWRKWETVEASNSSEALKTTEYDKQVMRVDSFDPRVGILGGVTEFLALTDAENNGWNPNSKIPKRS
jgi:hypothetical protein